MWFTERECKYNDTINFLIVFTVYITLAFIQLRQVLSYREIDNLELILAIITSAGFIFIIYIAVLKLNTGGCLGINEWWFFAGIIITLVALIINQITYEIVSPVSMVAWFFFYPALTIRAEGKEAAKGAVMGSMVLLLFGILAYVVVTNSWWWG
ncbi:hypothetical protein DRO97_06430, partial [Archaeoglobales archaeon]